MSNESNIGELVKAVNAVMVDVGYVRGTGRNTQQNYSYTSDEDLLKALQPAMAAHGLALIPTAISGVETDAAYQTKTGGAMWRRAAVVTYSLVHTTGAIMPVTVYAEGCDTADKAAIKLMTAAYKYALRQTFAVPTGDDAERDVKVGQESAQAAPRPTNGSAKSAGKATRYSAELQPTGNAEVAAAVLDALASAQTAFDTDEAKARAKTLWRTFSKAEQDAISSAVKAADETIAGMAAAGTV